MDFETYKKWTRETAVYPKEKEEEYLMIGLANEVGEVLGKYKKQVRGDGDSIKRFVESLVMLCGIWQGCLICMI